MVWSYSGDPGASNLDAVRFLIGDTVEATALLQDEEVEWLLSQNPNVYLAAAEAADSGASHLSTITSGGTGRVKTKTVGALSISYDVTERISELKSVSKSLRSRAVRNVAFEPYAGGISIADKRQRERDSDWDKPAFAIGMHDYPGTNQSASQFSPRSS